jgi:hypothetical protein
MSRIASSRADDGTRRRDALRLPLKTSIPPSRIVSKGDVVFVPSGMPHWYKDVEGTITYLEGKRPANPGGSGAGSEPAGRSE